jgi:hypothetical protein
MDLRVEILLRALLDRWRFHYMAFVGSVDGGQRVGRAATSKRKLERFFLRVYLED